MALKRKSVVPGVVVMVFGLLFFMVAVSDTLSFPPTKYALCDYYFHSSWDKLWYFVW